MLTSSDAKFRCMWYMVVWSVLLMFMSQFFSVTNVVAFYIFASATMLLLPLVTSIYSTTSGNHGAGLLRCCYHFLLYNVDRRIAITATISSIVDFLFTNRLQTEWMSYCT